jgi:hypothetical protein
MIAVESELGITDGVTAARDELLRLVEQLPESRCQQYWPRYSAVLTQPPRRLPIAPPVRRGVIRPHGHLGTG